jgi:hypothetical protein
VKSLLISLTLLILVNAAWSQKGWRDHEMEVKVKLGSLSEGQRLYDLHLNGDIHASSGYAIMYVVPAELKLLQGTGLPVSVLKDDLNNYYQDFWSGSANQYHTYDQIIALMDSLATAYPGICHKTLFGLTPQGRQLACLKISDSAVMDENEPEVLLDAGIHGDEIGGPENLVLFARALCTGYDHDPEITSLVNNREITIYPMVNPDGRANMSRYNSNFVDCNRDWGYMWNGEGNSPEAFSQVETRTLRDLIYNHRFIIHVTYHSGEEVVLYPWCYRAAHAPDYTALVQLSSIYSTSSGYPNLQYRQSYADYPTNGETIDYSYGTDGTDALTMEISNNKQPPASQIQYYYQANVPSMTAMITNAGYGIEGTVTDSITGAPVEAVIFVNNFFPVYAGKTSGYWNKYLLPGTFSIKVVANGFQDKTINNVVVGSQSSTVLDVQLHPGPGHYAMKVAAVAIPGNNPMDEANTPGVIGRRDSLFYSTGKNGWIIVDMQDPVVNNPGADFKVYDGDSIPERFTCQASENINGPWISLGTGMGTSSFDLDAAGMAMARFIKIHDAGDGQQNVSDAGFDLDAIESMVPPVGIKIMDENNRTLHIFPNPATEKIGIRTQKTDLTGLVTIYNPQGEEMIKQQLTDGFLQLNIHNLPAGLYFLDFTGVKTSQVWKFIKR